jgi:hypothetical protein
MMKLESFWNPHCRKDQADFCSGKDAQKHSALVGTRIINGQPGHSVVGPGWLQLGISNCPFVTRTAVWVHCAGIRLSLEHHRPPARLRRGIGGRQGPLASTGLSEFPLPKRPQFPIPDRSAGGNCHHWQRRNKCLARNNKSGPV